MDWRSPPSEELKQAAVRLGVTELGESAGDLARAIIGARQDSLQPSEEAVDLALYLGVEFDPATIRRRELHERTQSVSIRVSRQLVRDRIVREGLELEYAGGDYVIGRVDRVRFDVYLSPITSGWERARLSVVVVHRMLQEQRAAAERDQE